MPQLSADMEEFFFNVWACPAADRFSVRICGLLPSAVSYLGLSAVAGRVNFVHNLRLVATFCCCKARFYFKSSQCDVSCFGACCMVMII